jgi:hypothetical protein
VLPSNQVKVGFQPFSGIKLTLLIKKNTNGNKGMWDA